MSLIDIFKKPQQEALSPDLEEKMKTIATILFPNGPRDIPVYQRRYRGRAVQWR